MSNQNKLNGRRMDSVYKRKLSYLVGKRRVAKERKEGKKKKNTKLFNQVGIIYVYYCNDFNMIGKRGRYVYMYMDGWCSIIKM